ncbi:MAG: chromosomal replication initiator protein DnaA [Fibrobacter sp.]|jgi:chromosomal replication initiator protein|nr:chromosomal replication initiator protein DnaA [Fibrobacter sp.]
MLANNLSDEFSTTSPWPDCLRKIQEKVGPASYETWFRTTDLFLSSDGQAKIQVPNQFFADFIEEHFASLIKEVLTEADIQFSSLSFVPIQKDWKIVQPLSKELVEAQSRKIPHTAEKREQFHPNYTFDKFVVGDSNRMASAAALAVAEAPGKTSFNPLVIYGGTGLGKTHLLQAIGSFAQTEITAENVTYLTSEEFTNQYINYVINKKDSTSFYRKFAKVDLLLIDDIQFFSGKPGTQKEFFRIFNKLLLENKQIVLSSDRQPDKIPDMMDHIINRFMGGLITDIQPPNLETRMAILRKKAEIDGLCLPDEVVQFIAGHITSNIRELEGTLIKLIASSSFTGRDITLDVARELCGDAISRKGEKVSVKYIQQKTAEAFGISPNQLSAHTRKRDVSLPRSVAMYLCKKWTKQSLRSIGLDFGGRDYSTVIHSFKKIEANLKENQDLRQKVEMIEEQIKPLL